MGYLTMRQDSRSAPTLHDGLIVLAVFQDTGQEKEFSLLSLGLLVNYS